MEYSEFLASKRIVDLPTGLKNKVELNPMLFDFQKDIVQWALRRGRAAVFADCGMGKTPVQLEWARHIPGRVLIVAPLAVSAQTIREAEKFHEEKITYSPDGSLNSRIVITNYERIERFDPYMFTGIVLDESSILKSFTGKYRTDLIERFGKVQYRLACTATPAPNDFMELGNHAEFLGAMKRTEMLSMFFVHDGGETQTWRLKGHAESEFWKWVCSWAVMISKPSDLGYDDGKFILPPLEMEQITVHSEEPTDGMLFAMEAQTLVERQGARRVTIYDRAKACADIVNATNEQCLVWCDLNDESAMLTKLIPDAVEVKGSDTEKHKEDSLLGFSRGEIRCLVTKGKIAGFGMNFQSCHNVFFVGLSDSYETFYQAIRRCWRFGQEKPVKCYVITSDIEGAVVKNIKRKEEDAKRMAEMMVENMHEINSENIRGIERTRSEYKISDDHGKNWTMMLGDCIERIKEIPDESIGLSIFSPPFSSLYTFSNSERDMSNVKSHDQFMIGINYLFEGLYRVMMPGRIVAIHTMDLTTGIGRDGYLSVIDFGGMIIKAMQEKGFYYHTPITIWKNPVIEVTRTKNIQLLYHQFCKDATISRMALPDRVLCFRKPGINNKPVEHDKEKISPNEWGVLASPVWMDIDQSDTLNFREAREENDERHISCLQLGVIERILNLWSMPDDIIFSPCAGVGSEGYESIKLGRKFIGIELKESYFNQAVKNLGSIENTIVNESFEF